MNTRLRDVLGLIRGVLQKVYHEGRSSLMVDDEPLPIPAKFQANVQVILTIASATNLQA